MKDRGILHVDCNKFYASVECLHRPELRDKPVVVGGSEQSRHGIVLTKNEIAAKCGIKTGEALWQARNKCDGLVVVPPNYPLYRRFSDMVRQIVSDYTDKIEPFGLDECWLDVTGSGSLYGSPLKIAHTIRHRVKFELGITVSIGVSFNKVFAKLGSDYKKPDAVTAITRENFRRIAWPLPASDLLYVGSATAEKLRSMGISTIGGIAAADPAVLKKRLGKAGGMLHMFANGEDRDPVRQSGERQAVKSISNSFTAPRDLVTAEDVRMMTYVLADSVARRMRDHRYQCGIVSVSGRDSDLRSFTRQKKLARPTDLTDEIIRAALELFFGGTEWKRGLRSIGVAASDFTVTDSSVQLGLFCDNEKREALHRIDETVDSLKRRFGSQCIQRAAVMKDKGLARVNPYDDHTVHPEGFLNGKTISTEGILNVQKSICAGDCGF
ncbi:MAG: DNA polymerase thumb domain-containing protein [Acutalibacteraceae bacterium]